MIRKYHNHKVSYTLQANLFAYLCSFTTQNCQLLNVVGYKTYEPQYEISNYVVCATSKVSDQTAHQSFCLSLEYSMSVKLLTEHNLVFLSLKGGYRGSSESTLVKMPHC